MESKKTLLEGDQMPRKRDLKLEQYGISKEAYREMKHFCLQYEEKKRKLSACYSPAAPLLSSTPKSAPDSDTTARRAIIAAKLRDDLNLIEQTAIEASGALYQYIILNATNEGFTYEKLGPPCGRRQFYEYRRLFFYLLWRKMGNTGDVLP